MSSSLACGTERDLVDVSTSFAVMTAPPATRIEAIFALTARGSVSGPSGREDVGLDSVARSFLHQCWRGLGLELGGPPAEGARSVRWT